MAGSTIRSSNIQSETITLGSAGEVAFSSTTDSSGTADTGLSRDSAGVVDVGNGTPGDTSGSVKGAAIVLVGSSSGATKVAASATASGTLTLPATTDTLVGKATTDTLTNKTLTAPTITAPTITGAGSITAADFISNTANPAQSGVVRLANTDTIKWRNAANSADFSMLSVDSSNRLTLGDNSQNTNIECTGNMSPAANLTLGDSTHGWNALYVGSLATSALHRITHVAPISANSIFLIDAGAVSGAFGVGDPSDSSKTLVLKTASATTSTQTILSAVQTANRTITLPDITGTLVGTPTTVDLTSQSAAIGTTTLYAVPSTGPSQYRLSWNAKVTTAAGTSSTLGALTITWTDPDGVVQSLVVQAQVTSGSIQQTDTGNSTTTKLLGFPLLLNVKASTNIQYAFAYASNPGSAMVYNLHLRLEAL